MSRRKRRARGFYTPPELPIAAILGSQHRLAAASHPEQERFANYGERQQFVTVFEPIERIAKQQYVLSGDRTEP